MISGTCSFQVKDQLLRHWERCFAMTTQEHRRNQAELALLRIEFFFLIGIGAQDCWHVVQHFAGDGHWTESVNWNLKLPARFKPIRNVGQVLYLVRYGLSGWRDFRAHSELKPLSVSRKNAEKDPNDTGICIRKKPAG